MDKQYSMGICDVCGQTTALKDGKCGECMSIHRNKCKEYDKLDLPEWFQNLFNKEK